MQKIKLPYLVSSPSDTANAISFGFRQGWLAYKISSMHLMRGKIAANTRGGLMIIGGCDLSAEGDFKQLAAEISNESALHNYDAVFLALDEKPNSKSASFAGALGSELAKRRLKYYVPIDYSVFCPDARYIVTSEISGGSLKLHITELIDKHGVEKLAFDICRMRMDFTMPSPDSIGKALSPEEFNTIYENTDAQTFYSPELCLNYFTYTDTIGQSHFVLYDDARSILGKIFLADMLKLDCVLLNYSELKEILPQIRGGLEPA